MLFNKPSLILFFIIAAMNFLTAPALTADKYDPTTLVFPSFLHTLGIRKATETHLRIYTRNRVKVNNPQGLAVVRLKSWDNPNSSKDDDEVAGYGINSGKNIIVYNKSMTSLGFYGLNKKGRLALKAPTGVCADEDGNVYVADTGNHRVVHFFNPKAQLQFVKALGRQGSEIGLFDTPKDLALDSEGLLYVCDSGNHRIQILSTDGRVIESIQRKGQDPGQLWFPTGIAVTNGREKWSYYKSGFMVVIDLDGQRIQKFSLDGQLMAGLSLADIDQSTGKMMFVALDYYSNVWVTDINRHCIHKFDRNLQYLTSFGRQGNDHKEFIEPRGIAIYKRFGQVFIAEKESAQYFWIGTDISNLNSFVNDSHDVIELQFFLTEPSFVTLSVRKTNGQIKRVFERQRFFSGQQNLYLDGDGTHLQKAVVENEAINKLTDNSFVQPDSGRYRFTVKIEPTYSSFKYFSKEVETDLIIH